MEYALGVAFFAAAFLLVAFARRFYARGDLPRWASGFGSGEFAALVVVILLAGGFGTFLSRAFADIHDGNYLYLALGAAGVIAVAYVVRQLFGAGSKGVAGVAIEGAGIGGISVLPAGGPAKPANANRKRRAAKKTAA